MLWNFFTYAYSLTYTLSFLLYFCIFNISLFSLFFLLCIVFFLHFFIHFLKFLLSYFLYFLQVFLCLFPFFLHLSDTLTYRWSICLQTTTLTAPSVRGRMGILQLYLGKDHGIGDYVSFSIVLNGTKNNINEQEKIMHVMLVTFLCYF